VAIDNEVQASDTPRANRTTRLMRGVSLGRFRNMAIALVIVLTFGAGVGVDRFAWNGGSDAGASSSLTELPEFQTFQDTWNLVHDNFVDTGSIDDSKLLYAATSGMVDALGDTQHSTFLDPTDAALYKSYIGGKLVGIGVELDFSSGRPMITSTLHNSPADKAGIKAHDTILEINGQSTEGMSDSDVSTLLRGKEGTTVNLTLQHESETQPYEVDLTRAVIEIKPVAFGTLPNHIEWIRINQFSVGATDGVKEALRDAADNGARGYVLDLRGNPGGLAAEAIGVTSQFLPEGKTVYMVQDREGTQRPVKTLGTGLGLDLPMVVLVNEGSASSSEIVAASLRDNGRAEMIGEKTFGTGTILTPYSLEDGSIAVIGTQFWLTPKGELAWHKGVEPDLPVALPANGEDLNPEDDPRLSKAELDGSTDEQLKVAEREVLAAIKANP
jgi:carboxyl-terminal processing protease